MLTGQDPLIRPSFLSIQGGNGPIAKLAALKRWGSVAATIVRIGASLARAQPVVADEILEVGDSGVAAP
jgi:hypothetical protein